MRVLACVLRTVTCGLLLAFAWLAARGALRDGILTALGPRGHCVCVACSLTWGVAVLFARAHASRLQRLARTVLLLGAVGMILLLLALTLGGVPPFRNRILLGLVCVVQTMLAMGAGLGLLGYVGIPATPLSPMAAFVSATRVHY